MRRHGLALLLAGALPLLSGWAGSQAATDQSLLPAQSGDSQLTTREEDNPTGGRRIRVATPTVRINDLQGSLTLRLECMHPVSTKQAPDQCLINIIHRDIQAKYSLQRTARLRISADGSLAFDGKLSNLGTHKEGPEVVEPMVGVWDYSLVKKLTAAKKVAFLIEPGAPAAATNTISSRADKISVDRSCLDAMAQMLDYFR